MTFGERITSLRKQLKWSQDDLAKKIGTSAPIIGRYERNEIKPSIDVAKRIADQLNVTIDYLIGGTDTLFDKTILKKVEDIQKLSTEDKNTVFKLLDAFIRDTKTKQAYSQ
ncbi:MAG: helix-turn-helix transcriptional regulator [Flavobacteriales bacterium]|nr:helix-turn-helix transcriptional regulator [Flavobacteriales bacterium]